MDLDNKNVDRSFFNLIMSLGSACWQHLGKVPNPFTGKIERDMKGAQVTIELLSMIKGKTNGNLTDEESKMLTETISNMQINYVDEVKKDKDNGGKAVENKPATDEKPNVSEDQPDNADEKLN